VALVKKTNFCIGSSNEISNCCGRKLIKVTVLTGQLMVRGNTITKNFCRGSRGAVFLKRAPLAAGGKN